MNSLGFRWGTRVDLSSYLEGIVATMLPEFADQIQVFAGDMVPKKKPAPDIYNLAATTLGVKPARCVVIEDTRIGLLAGEEVFFNLFCSILFIHICDGTVIQPFHYISTQMY